MPLWTSQATNYASPSDKVQLVFFWHGEYGARGVDTVCVASWLRLMYVTRGRVGREREAWRAVSRRRVCWLGLRYNKLRHGPRCRCAQSRFRLHGKPAPASLVGRMLRRVVASAQVDCGGTLSTEGSHEDHPKLSKYDPHMPCSSTILTTAHGIKSMQYLEAVEGSRPVELDSRSLPASASQWVLRQNASGGQVVNPSSKDKRAAKRNAAALRDTLAEERPTKKPNVEGARTGKSATTRLDSRSASPGTGHWLPTCTATCSSSRAHELTAVSGAATLHRAVACPAHPNWTLSTSEKGQRQGQEGRERTRAGCRRKLAGTTLGLT